MHVFTRFLNIHPPVRSIYTCKNICIALRVIEEGIPVNDETRDFIVIIKLLFIDVCAFIYCGSLAPLVSLLLDIIRGAAAVLPASHFYRFPFYT